MYFLQSSTNLAAQPAFTTIQSNIVGQEVRRVTRTPRPRIRPVLLSRGGWKLTCAVYSFEKEIMKTQITTLHNGIRTYKMTEPVSGRKPVLALPIGLLASGSAIVKRWRVMRLLWAATLALPIFGARAGAVLTTLYSFGVFPNGENPGAALVQGSDGYFYGTTSCGGTNNQGTVFRISPIGALTSLYSFTGGNDGANPYAALVPGSDNNFYGSTIAGGGTNDAGTVFIISSNGVLTTLHSFCGNDGWRPNALVQSIDGYFYGTTEGGGATYTGQTGYGSGTVFRINTNGALTSLYSFSGGNDGGQPSAALVQTSDGYFYGTTYQGGTGGVDYGGYGTVFKISTNGALTTLHSFTSVNDGALPSAGLVQASDDSFYGTTVEGDIGGTVFKISTNGALTTLHSFNGTDGAYPDFALVQSSDGYLYGTTREGGTYGSYGGNGTVFKISTKGAFTSLYSFIGGNDGASPQAGLVQGSDGNFYGTTYGGGMYGNGTVFRISTIGVLTTLYSFGLVTNANGEAPDGLNPCGALVQGSDGNFYGTTQYNGYSRYRWDFFPTGNGTVFKISPNGALTTLYAFGSDDECEWRGAGWGKSHAGLVQGSDGYFYGTTANGGQAEPARFSG